MVRECYTEISPSEFFYRNKELAGFSNPTKALFSSVRELVENSLDACESYRILPEIIITLRQVERVSDEVGVYSLRVQDNGSGVPGSRIPEAFGKVFFSSKYTLKQHRGTFGLGGTMTLLYGQLTTNSTFKVTSSTGGKYIHSYELSIDVRRNKPRVHGHVVMENHNRWRGTIVELKLRGNYSRSASKILDYLKLTAVSAPYASIVFADPEGKVFVFPRATKEMPLPPRETRPHPQSVDYETFLRIAEFYSEKGATLMEMMMRAFDRVGERIATNFLLHAGLNPKKKVSKLRRDELKKLYDKMQTFDRFLPPRGDVLSPIGERLFASGVKKEFKPLFLHVITRRSSSYGGNPFIVEAAIAVLPQPPKVTPVAVYRFANRIPLIYDASADVVSKVLSSIDWSRYKLPPDKQVALFTHICSTKIPYKSLGKEAVADVPEVEREVRLVIRELLKRVTLYERKVEREARVDRRRRVLERYLRKIAKFSAELAERDEPDVTRLVSKLGGGHR